MATDFPVEETPDDKKSSPVPPTPEELQREFTDLIRNKFGGHVQVMAMGPGGPAEESASERGSEKGASFTDDILSFTALPKEIKEHLDLFVVGQDDVKKVLSVAVSDHYRHIKASLENESQAYQKQNLLILGPTGVGKTYLIEKVADFIGVPFVKADATRFSEVGYMGANVDDVIRNLVDKADGNIAMAENGIVYIDEIDKTAAASSRGQKDVSGRGVQFGFLRLLEDSKVDLNASHDMASQFKTFMSFQKRGKAVKEVVRTKNILFIFSGAFQGIDKIIEKRMSKNQIGLHHNRSVSSDDSILQHLQAQDLIQFGFEHEFVGRLPVRSVCQNLTTAHLWKILNHSKESLVQQYKDSFRNYGIQLTFDDKALMAIAEKAEKQKTGARALSSVLSQVLRPFKFELPSTAIDKLHVSPELVENPNGYLHHLLSGSAP